MDAASTPTAPLLPEEEYYSNIHANRDGIVDAVPVVAHATPLRSHEIMALPPDTIRHAKNISFTMEVEGHNIDPNRESRASYQELGPEAVEQHPSRCARLISGTLKHYREIVVCLLIFLVVFLLIINADLRYHGMTMMTMAVGERIQIQTRLCLLPFPIRIQLLFRHSRLPARPFLLFTVTQDFVTSSQFLETQIRIAKVS
jgi:hypothetical protein